MPTTVCRERFDPRRILLAPSSRHDQCRADPQEVRNAAALLLLVGRSGPLGLVVAAGVVIGFCSVAMPAMTSVVMSDVAASRAGLAGGVLNTARQAGGALGAAVLGTLLIAEAGISLRTPMIVIIAGYAAAIGLTLLATSRRAGLRSSADSER